MFLECWSEPRFSLPSHRFSSGDPMSPRGLAMSCETFGVASSGVMAIRFSSASIASIMIFGILRSRFKPPAQYTYRLSIFCQDTSIASAPSFSPSFYPNISTVIFPPYRLIINRFFNYLDQCFSTAVILSSFLMFKKFRVHRAWFNLSLGNHTPSPFWFNIMFLRVK